MGKIVDVMSTTTLLLIGKKPTGGPLLHYRNADLMVPGQSIGVICRIATNIQLLA